MTKYLDAILGIGTLLVLGTLLFPFLVLCMLCGGFRQPSGNAGVAALLLFGGLVWVLGGLSTALYYIL